MQFHDHGFCRRLLTDARAIGSDQGLGVSSTRLARGKRHYVVERGSPRRSIVWSGTCCCSWVARAMAIHAEHEDPVAEHESCEDGNEPA